MHIGLLLQADRNWLGGVDYIRNLVLALGNLPLEERRDLRLSLVSDTPLHEELEQTLAPYLHMVVDRQRGLPPRTLTNRLAWVVRRHLQGQHDPRFTRFCQASGIEFVYPFQGNPGRHAGYRSAAWIADFQHKHLPHFFTQEEIRQRETLFAKLAASASRVVLSSEAAAVDYRRSYPEHASKVRILRFAVWTDPCWQQGDSLAVQAAYCLPDRFFLICNQFWQHKNHLLVLEAMRQLGEHGIRPELVCTGHLHDYRNPGFADRILQTIHHYGLNSQVRLLGIVPRQEQIQLMRRCLAIIQPSLFEGWSTIVEFAKSLGRPLILSDLPVHREQSPNGTFFSPDSASELAALMATAWNNLEPGPDPISEQEGLQASQVRAADFARNFLDLARTDDC